MSYLNPLHIEDLKNAGSLRPDQIIHEAPRNQPIVDPEPLVIQRPTLNVVVSEHKEQLHPFAKPLAIPQPTLLHHMKEITKASKEEDQVALRIGVERVQSKLNEEEKALSNIVADRQKLELEQLARSRGIRIPPKYEGGLPVPQDFSSLLEKLDELITLQKAGGARGLAFPSISSSSSGSATPPVKPPSPSPPPASSSSAPPVPRPPPAPRAPSPPPPTLILQMKMLEGDGKTTTYSKQELENFAHVAKLNYFGMDKDAIRTLLLNYYRAHLPPPPKPVVKLTPIDSRRLRSGASKSVGGAYLLKELQKLCDERGLSSVGKADILRARLDNWLAKTPTKGTGIQGAECYYHINERKMGQGVFSLSRLDPYGRKVKIQGLKNQKVSKGFLEALTSVIDNMMIPDLEDLSDDEKKLFYTVLDLIRPAGLKASQKQIARLSATNQEMKQKRIEYTNETRFKRMAKRLQLLLGEVKSGNEKNPMIIGEVKEILGIFKKNKVVDADEAFQIMKEFV